jgi:lactate dehydrogenase-like 2-hydroxyacid dehydrogenase
VSDLPDILVIKNGYPEPTARTLEERFACHHLWKAADRNAFLKSVADRVRGVATWARLGADAELIGRLPRLEIIAGFGVGYDKVDLAAAKARGIVVTNTPGVLTAEVANMGLALLLALARRIVAGDRMVREGRWKGGATMGPTPGLEGRTAGIVGLGAIGSAVARRLEGFGVAIVYHGPRKKPVAYRHYDDLVAMARDADILILTCPGSPATRHLVDARVLDALGPDGMLINIARGAVVDEKALVKALSEGRLGGAGLDVFADEPRAPEALFALDNVVLQPHVASNTVGTREAMGRVMVENLAAHFAGRPVPNPVRT